MEAAREEREAAATTADQTERKWMEEAFAEAEAALGRGEVPVGCVLVSGDGEVIGRGSNRCNEMRDGTQHAELVAYSAAREKLGAVRLKEELARGVRLYVTCEPCIMCAAALVLLNVQEVVYGCANDKFGGCGSVRAVHTGKFGGEGIAKITSGVMEQDAIRLLQQFYNSANPRAPIPKRKRTR
mmetsp:Transcript_6029/g.18172  ORF Transcript_6029/g.18172 Transcript_6029/m.18172 type:complete len:184 (-) Transcript_6029:1845-2396(-)